MAILEDRAKRTQRDTANELAAENERMKRQEEQAEWIDLSAGLLSAAESVLNAWERTPLVKDTAALAGPIAELYGAVMDFNRKVKEHQP